MSEAGHDGECSIVLSRAGPKADKIQGKICANPECEAHYHTYCYNQLVEAGRDKCSACRAHFSDFEPLPLGEESVPRREDQWGTLHSRRKRRHQEDDDDEEDQEVSDLESEEEVEVSDTFAHTSLLPPLHYMHWAPLNR